MSDLISRQAAIDALTEDEYSEFWDCIDSNIAADIIRRLPSAQPEIIRCKDCKYGVVDDPEIPTLYFCEHSGQDWNDENHYCGYAKRREVTT